MSIGKLIIRLAREDELKVVQDLNYKLFVSDNRHFHDLNLRWPYEEKGTEYFKHKIDGTKGVCFVAEKSGKVIGYLAGSTFDAGSAYLAKRAELDNMFVEEEFRSSGIGATLVEEFKNWCKQNQVEKIFVNAFSPNTRAIAFYKKTGFEEYSLTLSQDI